MRRLSNLTSMWGTVSLLLLVLLAPAAYSQNFMPSMMGPPMGGMMPSAPMGGGLCGPPMAMGPCVPDNTCKTINVEGGGRLLYITTNEFKLKVDNGSDINLAKDLNFSCNNVVGEVYAAVRMPKFGALTYTFLIPRTDNGNGVLISDLDFNGRFYPVGTPVTSKLEISRHRWEAEYFLSVGCNSRVAGLLLGELWVRNFELEGPDASTNRWESTFLMGVGGTVEYAPANGFFLKGKGVFKFLQDQTGWYLEGAGRYFPEMNQGCGGMDLGFRPYGGVGFRWESSNWRINENLKLQTSFYGPFAEVGVVF
jgi:hypothetical protein